MVVQHFGEPHLRLDDTFLSLLERLQQSSLSGGVLLQHLSHRGPRRRDSRRRHPDEGQNQLNKRLCIHYGSPHIRLAIKGIAPDSNDMNGDGGTNDLIYIPRDASELQFQQYTVSGRTFTVQEQIDAFNKYIENDPYLRKNRGKYAERGAAMLPMVFRADLSIAQEFFTNLFEKRNALEFRIDLLNVGNLLNKKWGVGNRYRFTSNNSVQPLQYMGVDANGVPILRFRNTGTQLLTDPIEQTTELTDVFRIQLGVRYTFN